MTTIVIKDGVMGVDSRAYSGQGSVAIGAKNKMHRLDDGSLIAVSSIVAGLAERVIEYINDSLEGEYDPSDIELKNASVTMLMLKENGDVYYANDTLYWSGPIEAAYFAIGSGAEYALGAFAMGANVVRALEVAIEHDVYTDYPIRTCSIDQDIPTVIRK
jgi:20S proteasome alpha/beta subunit